MSDLDDAELVNFGPVHVWLQIPEDDKFDDTFRALKASGYHAQNMIWSDLRNAWLVRIRLS